LSIAVANAGGMGAMGALLTPPTGIRAWVREFRSHSQGPLQLNLWIPDPPPRRDSHAEEQMRGFLARWGPPVPPSAGETVPPDFGAQCEAFLDVAPTAVSSIMGVFPPAFVSRCKQRGIAWFATATTLAEASAARDAGADAIIAQGYEAGGHRGSFNPAAAHRQGVGLLALLPRLADRIDLPIVAAGGIGDGRGVAAALTLGASAAMLGTAFLRCPEAQTHPAWANALDRLEPEDTTLTRAFTGPAGPRHRYRFRASRRFIRCSGARSLSGAARAYRAHERSRSRGWRLSPHAGVGRAVGGDGPAGSGRRSGPSDLGASQSVALSGLSIPLRGVPGLPVLI
jgi:nitronate monooxygenase